jgi:hypothetical protein
MPVDETSTIIGGTSDGLSESSRAEEPSSRRLLASAVLIGAGMLIEPELLGGALLGAGVVYGFPLVAKVLRPVATTAVQLGYTAVAGVGDLLAGARGEIQTIVTTARSGYQKSHDSTIVTAR